ncbi:MAG: hypothetical protein IPM39_25455 [Chloroflexi bacterium]|nr:hypothetical protein [Chloroflexota bacterium]
MFLPDIKVETTRAKHSVADVLRTGNWLDACRRQHPSAPTNQSSQRHLALPHGGVGRLPGNSAVPAVGEIAYCAQRTLRPGCGHFEEGAWLEKQKALLLPAPTTRLSSPLDHVFNPLVRYNQKLLYDLLFQTASAAAEEPMGEVPMVLVLPIVLHTWGQTIQFHPTFTAW